MNIDVHWKRPHGWGKDRWILVRFWRGVEEMDTSTPGIRLSGQTIDIN